MIINVLQRHIDCGRRMSCDQCAVALAIVDATGARSASVDVNVIYLYRDTHVRSEVYDMPAVAAQFIELVDTYKTVSPISFELPIEAVPS